VAKASGGRAKVEEAMREVHTNVPKNVKKTGKTGKSKEAMLRAIAFSKARASGARPAVRNARSA